MGGVRRWLHHRWIPYLAGALAGLIIAASTSAVWHHTYSQPAVTLMGTGHGLSALISTASARVLVVGGDDPIAFANAFADARPSTMRRIDVLVITPDASTSVAERAVELAAPQRIMAIDSREDESDTPDVDDPVRKITAPRTIDLAGDLLIDIDPGLIAGQPDSGWSIRVQSESAAVLLAASAPFRPTPSVELVAIMGSTIPPAVRSVPVPVVIAADVSDAPSGDYGLIALGETQRIPIEPASVTLPVEWVVPPED